MTIMKKPFPRPKIVIDWEPPDEFGTNVTFDVDVGYGTFSCSTFARAVNLANEKAIESRLWNEGKLPVKLPEPLIFPSL
jgi:hypothetical protein